MPSRGVKNETEIVAAGDGALQASDPVPATVSCFSDWNCVPFHEQK